MAAKKSRRKYFGIGTYKPHYVKRKKKSKSKKGHVPLAILKKRLVKLAKVVASRSKRGG